MTIFRFLIVSLLFSFMSLASAQVHFSNTTPSSPDIDGALSIIQGGETGAFTARGWSKTTSAPQLSSPKYGDVDGDGVVEILLSTYGISNPYGEGYLYVWKADGTDVSGFPKLMAGAPPGTPAVGDLDGDGAQEIVQGTWSNLYIFNGDGSNFTGWPKAMYVTQSAALADLDNDGDLEIIVPSSTSMWAYHHDGTPVIGFPVVATNDLTEAAVGDLDGDGDLEILSGSFKASGSPADFVYAWHHDGSLVAGFPVTTVGSVKVAPALADLDADGTLEVIADCWNKSGTDELYVWDHTGTLEPGWPKSIAYIRLSSPSVADLDSDGDLEILVGGWQTSPSAAEVVNALHHDGTAVAGFPVALPVATSSGNVNNTCTAGDIDGDGLPEIVVKGHDQIHALNHDGSVAAGFPIFLDDESHSGTISPTPAIGDPDADGLVEIFAASSYNNVMLIEQTGFYSSELMPWPTHRTSRVNNGTYRAPTLTVDTHTVSAATGGPVNYALAAGSANGLRNYLMLAGVTGTEPGTHLPGNLAVLPLNWDVFTDIELTLLNTIVFWNFLGQVDGSGNAAAQLNAPPMPPVAVGVLLRFAYTMNSPFDFASNSVTVRIDP